MKSIHKKASNGIPLKKREGKKFRESKWNFVLAMLYL
jgi:hypothetical protein